MTRRGVEAAVLVPIEEWRPVAADIAPDLKSLLLAPTPRFDNMIPRRGKLKLRPVMEFD